MKRLLSFILKIFWPGLSHQPAPAPGPQPVEADLDPCAVSPDHRDAALPVTLLVKPVLNLQAIILSLRTSFYSVAVLVVWQCLNIFLTDPSVFHDASCDNFLILVAPDIDLRAHPE